MSDEEKKSLVQVTDLFGLSKGAEKLVAAIEQGVGNLLAPWQRERMNRKQITAFQDWNKALEKSGLSVKAAELSIEDRTAVRLLAGETRRQSNREAIALDAAQEFHRSSESPNATADTTPELDVEWLDRFWNLAQDVSDSEMQQVWGRILARQASGVAKYSARALQTLSLLSRDEARELERIATLAIRADLSYKTDHYILTSFNSSNEKEQLKDINHRLIAIVKKLHREVFGPAGIYLDSGSGWGHDASVYVKDNISSLLICEKRIEISFPPRKDGNKNFGGGLALSPVGMEILDLINVKADEEYLKAIVDGFKILDAEVRVI